MALATYSDLKTAVANWTARADLTSIIPDFITLCHAQLMRELRGHLRMQKRDSAFSITGEYVACPSDFLELVSMYVNSTPKVYIQYLSGDQATAFYASTTSGTPQFVTIVGSSANVENFRFTPVPSGTTTATIEYYASLAAMSGASDTNWILTGHPDAYLYGSLLQASTYLKDDPRIPAWAQMYQAAVASIKKEGNRARWGANNMQMRPA